MRINPLSWLIVGIVLFILCLKALGVCADWLWFESEGYGSVYAKILATRVGLFLALSVPFFFALYLPWRKARRVAASVPVPVSTRGLDPDQKAELDRTVDRAVLIFALLAASVAGLIGSNKWMTLLQWTAATPFQLRDPIFDKEVAFYLFKLPLLQFLLSYVTTAIGLGLAGSLLLFIYDDLLQFGEQATYVSPRAGRMLLTLTGVLFLMLALGNYLGRFHLLYSPKGIVYGAGYREVYAQLPGIWLMLIICLVAGVVLLVTAKKGEMKPLRWCLTALAGGYVLLRILLPAGVQAFIVTPNEIEKEKRFIKYNIDFTRKAYGLHAFVEQPHPAKPLPSRQDLIASTVTLKNVRLWDNRPLLETYGQLQSIRPYYGFLDVDFDRYLINGEYRQVAIAARELIQHEEARTWVNDHLKYTHGYGVVMAPVNDFSGDGSPLFFLSDIPTTSSMKMNLKVKRNEIYFGEFSPRPQPRRGAPSAEARREEGEGESSATPPMPGQTGEEGGAQTPPSRRTPSRFSPEATEQSPVARKVPTLTPSPKKPTAYVDYVIVNTKEPEFDYPKEDGYATCYYQGKGGVRIGSFLRRLIFAARFMDTMILFTDAITPKSRVLMYRRVVERVRKLAPFLVPDPDAYIVLTDEGRLVWIVDTYTVSLNFPYSTPVERNVGNYIRNSVKVTVDAYDGTTRFYVVDPSDPLVRTYQRLFPKLFSPMSAMPEDIRRHLRYPKLLFTVQGFIYSFYHMTDPVVFYNKEDVWEVAKETFARETLIVEPYYVVMKPPGESKESFLLMLPFCPKGKNNMIAWMAAHCDPHDYGKVLVFQFPRDRTIHGPLQVEARIDQDPEISKSLTLWDQRGSQVIRGNLLVIPIADSLSYIEPLYLVAETTKFPQLKKVIVASAHGVAMADSLWEGINQVFGTDMSEESTQPLISEIVPKPSPPVTPAPTKTSEEVKELLLQVLEQMQQADAARRRGNWQTFEEKWKRTQQLLRQAAQ